MSSPHSPLITIYVRHSSECSRTDPYAKNCKCRKHLRWSHAGRQFRQSANTRTWAIAEQARKRVEDQFAAGVPEAATAEVQERQTIERAIELFISDKRSQGVTAGVLGRYEHELGRFKEFMQKRGRHFPSEITLEALTEYRAGWEEFYPSSNTRVKVQERLRGFLRYCFESGLLARVPRLSPIKVTETPTLPLSDAQYTKLLKVIPSVFDSGKAPDLAQRARALIQLMRHSGLAIHDAVTLRRAEVELDEATGVYQVVTARQKTGTHVSVPIPPDVAGELLAAMKLNKHRDYIFWNSGAGQPQTAVKNWHHYLRRVFDAAGLKDGHPHQLRDTFAVGLLSKGVPMEEVSKLLGHESIKTTEKDYAKWVGTRQDRLNRPVIATWKRAGI